MRRAACSHLQQRARIVLELRAGRVVLFQAVLAARCQHCPGRSQASSQAKYIVLCVPECTQAHRISWARSAHEVSYSLYAKLLTHVVVIAQAHLSAASRTAVMRSAGPLTKKGQVNKRLSV